MNTKNALIGITRPVRSVKLPSGATVHVRALSLAELRTVRDKATTGGDSDEDRGLWLCAHALSEADGSPTFPTPGEVELGFLLGLTPADLDAIAEAAADINTAKKDDAKKS